jgi:hypothetical protein
MTSSLPQRLHPAASARFTPEGTGAVEPWHTCLLDYSLTDMAYGFDVASEAGVATVAVGATPFLKGRSSSE